MPVLYLAGSLAGIAMLVGLNFLLFGRVRPEVGTVDSITQRLMRDIPGFRPGRTIIGADRRVAVIENAATRTLVLVEAIGDSLVTRQLTQGFLANVGRLGARLSLELRDFTYPRAVLVAPSERVARDWEARLKP
ncbi:MAG TPA: hypothetical protein VMU22_05475 [Rhizomicrobium sp.]|nr:hypothetical protein [Rhizomicrobium sp.]